MKPITHKKMAISILVLTLGRFLQSFIASPIKRYVFVMVIVGLLLVPDQWSRAADVLYVKRCATETEAPYQAPYQTLTSAVEAANPGDSILMEAGIYSQTLPITKKLNIYSQNGPAIITKGKYNVGWKDVVVPRPCEGTNFNARVYYPSWETGPNTQIAHSCQGSFPVVVYAHGLSSDEREICEGWDDPGPWSEDYKQAGGILSRLAASGMIAVSVSWVENSNVTHISGFMIDALAYLRDKNQEQGSWVEGKVNLDYVGLLGHSNGGAGANDAASTIRMDYCNEDEPLDVKIKALGMIAPSYPWNNKALSVPVLVINGTREHCRQVGLSPLELYCESNAPKHLVYVIGANHFGYTDGICLEPDIPATNQNCLMDSYGIDAKKYLPTSVGKDNESWVGGLAGQGAHALQQRAAGNYLEAFFSYYLHDHLSDYSDIPDYLVQKDGTVSQCGNPGDGSSCVDAFEYGPPIDPDTDCEPKRLFDDLVSSNVEVSVCHAITCP